MSGGLRGESHFAAEIAQSADQPLDGLGSIVAIEVIGAEIRILNAVAQHEVGGREHRGRDGT